MAQDKKPAFLDQMALPRRVEEIFKAFAAEGGRPLLVGGYVRDLALNRTFDGMDLDVEVHQLSLEKIEEVLAGFGKVDLVGKQFGVFRLRGVNVDWSIPRRDSKGRHPAVEPDPWMGVEEAARRRDLTINSMALDPVNRTLHDPFGGLDDLKRGVLRPPDPDRFAEDPLRYYRVMAFVGRLEMKVDPGLTRLCSTMDLSGVARERIEDEFAKLFLSSRRPSLGIRWIETTGRLEEILPEASPLVGLEQDPKWHPEGDVWIHTLQVMDAAAAMRIGDQDQDLMLLWAALCHDLGKAETTQMLDGRIRSPCHPEHSGALTRSLMSRCVTSTRVIEGAVKLGVHHLKPHDFRINHAGPKAFKRLALALAPETSLERLAALALADYRGRNPDGGEPLDIPSAESAWFLEKAEQLEVKHEPEPPVLLGRHLLDRIEPGPELGRLLKRAYEIQLGEGIKDVEILKARVLED